MSETRSVARRTGLFATVRESLAGGERDYTTETIGRAVTLLAIPMVLEMLMESVFAVVDVYFVARLGVDAVAAVGQTEAMVSIIYAVAVGLSMSTTAMVARRIGEKNREGASDATVQAMGLGVIVAACIAVPGAIFAPDLLRLMGGSTELVTGGQGYTRMMLGGNVTIVLLFLLNAVFRGAGDAALAMRVLWLANGINIVLDPCLIFGWGPFPELGLTGAAVATNIGRGVGVCFQLVLLFRGRGTVKLGRGHLRLRGAVMLRLMRVSMGGIGQFLISTSSWVVLVRLVSGFGAVAVAGYTIAIRIFVVALMPAWGIANAAPTLVGQNLGAGRPDRAEASVWRVGVYNAVFLVLVAIVFITWAGRLVGIFTDDPDVIAAGRTCLRTISYGYGAYAFGMVMIQAFNGAGDTRTPTVINFFCYWCFQIPLAWLLSYRAGLESTGVFVAILAAEVVMTVAGVLVFRRGGWKTQEI
ncbi:MAG: MATE family efflux transporter [bacterium]|nr:MATE family efflux transporter [bacterium]